MQKFLRRYSQWILAIFGSLLVIVFLAPTAIQEFFQRQAQSGLVWATMDGEKVKDDVRAESAWELENLERVGMGIPIGNAMNDPAHWFLLRHEAEQAGLVANRASAEMDPELAAAIFLRLGQTQRLETALARFNGVMRLIGRWQYGTIMSDRRMEAVARRIFHGVTGRMIVLEATAEGQPMPDEQSILEHFETYRDVEPGTGDFGFGYRLPDRFSIEAVTVPYDAIRNKVANSDDIDGVELAKHWKRLDGDARFPVFELGKPIPESVRDDLIDERTEAARRSMEKWINARITERTRGMTIDDEGYVVLPEDWNERRLDIAGLVDTLPEAFEGLDGVTYRNVGDTLIEIDELADRGFDVLATTDRFGSTTMSLPQLIASIKSFEADPTTLLQANFVGPVLDLPDGGLMVYRVLDVDAARAPRDLGEVREQVVLDLQRRRHYDALLAERSAMETQAENEGLLALGVDRGATVQQARSISIYNPFLFTFMAQQGQTPPRQPTPLPVLGANEDVVMAIIDTALALDPTKAPSTLPSTDRIASFEADANMAVIVFEFTGQQPLTRERFEELAMTPGIFNAVMREEFGDLTEDLIEAFGYEALRARHAFEVNQRGNDAEIEAAAEEAATASAS